MYCACEVRELLYCEDSEEIFDETMDIRDTQDINKKAPDYADTNLSNIKCHYFTKILNLSQISVNLGPKRVSGSYLNVINALI